MPNAIAILAGLGAVLMAYLTQLNVGGVSLVACDFGKEISCSAVGQSDFATLAGVPVSILGLAYFLTVMVLVLRKRQAHRFGIIASFTVFSLVFSAYLLMIEIAIIGAICIFCETSKLLMVAILALALIAAKKGGEKIRHQWIIGAAAVGLVFSLAAYGLQREPAPTRDYSILAQCLTGQGASMYGSYICPACAKQKRLFGAAFNFIDEVECHPRGPEPQVERCVAKRIAKTPTWIQERGGVEARRIEGVWTPEELAEMFGCPAE
ncbi:vitamin K epoxide reductase family protein [Candidatus Uhrbacteria bacterium]|nr:vitamin K epoxide reductase family protein [Candidatus Uhrbacteria bacterium]